MDLQRILVPLDGSDLSERALPLAAQLAGRAGSELILTRAPLARVFSGLDAIEGDPAEGGVQAEAETYLRAVAEGLEARGLACAIATPLSPTEAEGGLVGQVARPSFPFRQLADLLREAAEAIVREADARRAGLIIMATHGRSGLDRWVHGSTALEVLRRAAMPVLLVRAAGPETLPEAGDLRVLVALDGSALAETALPPAMALLELLGGSLVLVRAVPTARPSLARVLAGPLMVDPTEHAALRAAAESYLEDTRHALAERGIPASAAVVEGDAAPAIADTAKEQGCALVAIATHGRTGFARLASEHVAETIMASAPALVLVVRLAGEVAERVLVTADEAVEPAVGGGASLLVRLSDEERELAQTALLALLQTVSRDEHLVEPIQRLVAKLDAAGHAPTDELASG